MTHLTQLADMQGLAVKKAVSPFLQVPRLAIESALPISAIPYDLFKKTLMGWVFLRDWQITAFRVVVE
jgi:hypothetical protein